MTQRNSAQSFPMGRSAGPPSLFHGGLSEEIQVIVGLIMTEDIMLLFRERSIHRASRQEPRYFRFLHRPSYSVDSRIPHSELSYIQKSYLSKDRFRRFWDKSYILFQAMSKIRSRTKKKVTYPIYISNPIKLWFKNSLHSENSITRIFRPFRMVSIKSDS